MAATGPDRGGVRFFSSVRWRLVGLFAAWLALALLVSGALVYGQMVRSLRQSAARQLDAQVATLAARVAPQTGNAHGDRTGPANPDLLPHTPGFDYQVTDVRGKLLNRSANGPPLPWSVVPAGQIALEQTHGDILAYVSRPVASGAPPTVLIQVATPWAPFASALATLRRILAGVGLIALALAVTGALAAARSALRPVETIDREVAAIRPTDLSVRLDASGPLDEFGRLRQHFNQMLDRIADALEQQRRFVADASHELRTPLAVIQGYTELLRRWGKDDPAVLAESLDAIRRETAWMVRLVSDMLAVARLESGPTMASVSVDLTELVRATVATMAVLDPERVLQTGPVAERVRVLGDAQQLRQVLTILLDNAIRHSGPAAAVTVTLATAEGSAHLQVADQGGGISPEDLPRVFDRFYRSDRARQRSGGTGLGLAIAHAIIEAHGGRIAITSAPGQGTTVRVTLPLQVGPPPPAT